MAKKTTSNDIELELQAFIGLRYFSQEVAEIDNEIPLGNTVEYIDKRIAGLIEKKYAAAEKTKKAAEPKPAAKTPAKKAPVKKESAKKEPVKKAAVKKAAVKEAPAKKTAPKKEAVKKVAAKKETVKKAPAKKAKK